MNGCTFLWLDLLIVELWVLARYIFSICVMFSLPLWMASVYCELPLEDFTWRSDITHSVVSLGLSAPHIHIFHFLLVRVCFSRCSICLCCKYRLWCWEKHLKSVCFYFPFTESLLNRGILMYIWLIEWFMIFWCNFGNLALLGSRWW